MAIYHLSVKTISRSAGRSATAAAAYRAGVRIEDERTGLVHDYRRRGGVVSADLVLPVGSPEWDRAGLWNAAEQSEKRKNSTVAREFELALPCELNDAQRRELALGFAREIAGRHGVVVDVAIHSPAHDGELNHHAHLLCSTRRLGADGFGQKSRELDDQKTGPAIVSEWRERWAMLTNAALAAAGVDASVDHRSLYAQREEALAIGDDEQAAALDRPATSHRGPAVSGLVERGDYSDVAARQGAEVAAQVALIGARQAAEADLARIEAELAAASAEAAAAAAEVEDLLARAAAPRPRPERPRPQPIEEPQRRPAPAPAVPEIYRPARQEIERIEADLVAAESRLVALEDRERRRQRAAAAYRVAQDALRAAQAGLWARFAAWAGLPTPASVRAAQEALRAAGEALRAAPVEGLRGGVGRPLPEVADLRRKIQALRAQRAELKAQEEAIAAADALAVGEVVCLVQRLDAAFPDGDPRRRSWRTLRLVDDYDLAGRLAEAFMDSPDMRREVIEEVTRRWAELEAAEEASRPADDWQAPGM